MRAVVSMLVVAANLELVGCDEPAPTDACTPRSWREVFVGSEHIDTLDVLFMIDNSGSMAEEQVQFIEQLPRFVGELAAGDRDDDGTRDFTPVRSLHIGVITSDLGAGPNIGVPTCAEGLGDDGILRSRSRVTSTPCMGTYPSGVFAFARDTDDTVAFAAGVGCVANLGTGGCGFEQQLEASLKALTPIAPHPWTQEGYAPPRFVSPEGVPDSAGGQADGANSGFLRSNSVLAVVLLTDEEDCSLRDYGLLVTSEPRFMGVPLNLRCHTFGEPATGIVQPVQRYVDGFLGLRRDPRSLVFSAIAGIPPEAEPPPGSTPDFDAVLASPGMAQRPNAVGPNLEPPCPTVNGVAYPPVRIVETAAALHERGAAVSLSSICVGDFRPAFDGLIERIAGAMSRTGCLAQPLETDADGRVACEVLELLPEAGGPGASDCTSLAGREHVETQTREGEGPRQLCRIAQLARGEIGARDGWYYDDFSDDGARSCVGAPRLTFTRPVRYGDGTELRFECGGVTLEAPCETDE